jgi:hypothetical protein
MLSTFFDWLRRKAAESILAGVNDAAKQLVSQAEEPGPPTLLVWQGGEHEEKQPKRTKQQTA